MTLSVLGPFASVTSTVTTVSINSLEEDPSKKIRKPYTITKSRESWTDPEHDKFLEVLHLFDRDWKKIEAFVGSKTVIQIRSHAQKYFLKVQKSGTNEHLPPPVPNGKLLIHIPRKHQNMLKHPSTCQVLSCFHLLYLNLGLFKCQIHYQC